MKDETIQSMGGKARDAALSDEQKSEIAKKAAVARWGLKATHKGSFKEQFSVDVECYVLNDHHKTAVISQKGMAQAIGLSPRGNALPRFLMSKAMKEYVGAHLMEKLTQPIKFQGIGSGAQVVHGYDATLLIDLCQAVVAGESRLNFQQRHVATQAHVILGASARSGIKGLVYALAGYNPTAEEVIQAFKQYVQEEARKYEKEFPPELYQAWYRLYQIQPIQGRGRPWQFKKLTVDHIYAPLAKSNGKILELTRALRAKDGDRKKKLFQFLNEVGTRALRMHLGRVLEMAEESGNDSAAYEKRLNKRFGTQSEFDFETPHST